MDAQRSIVKFVDQKLREVREAQADAEKLLDAFRRLPGSGRRHVLRNLPSICAEADLECLFEETLRVMGAGTLSGDGADERVQPASGAGSTKSDATVAQPSVDLADDRKHDVLGVDPLLARVVAFVAERPEGVAAGDIQTTLQALGEALHFYADADALIGATAHSARKIRSSTQTASKVR